MFSLLYSFAFLGLSLFGHPQSRGEAVERHRVDHWTYQRATDRFTGRQRCMVAKRGVMLTRGVVIFRFKPDVDTRDAWYRLDDGPAVSLRTHLLDLRRLGEAPSTGDNLANPSDGTVRLPLVVLGQAQKVTIRPNAKRSARVFGLEGLATTIAVAKADGCDPEKRY